MRTKAKRICKYCKKSYFSNAMIYCSKSCRAKDTGVGHGIKTGGYVKCSTCNKELWRKGYALNKHKNHFCNIQCFAEFKKTLVYDWCSGDKQWNWKGGISFIGKALYKQLRKIKKYTDWRTAIFTRDNFTCQNCGQIGGKMNVDHFPRPFSEIIAENSIKTIEDALSCYDLWDTKNGRTLCVECHKKIGFKGSYIIRQNC